MVERSPGIAVKGEGTCPPSYSKSQTPWKDPEEYKDISKLSPVTPRSCAWNKIFA